MSVKKDAEIVELCREALERLDDWDESIGGELTLFGVLMKYYPFLRRREWIKEQVRAGLVTISELKDGYSDEDLGNAIDQLPVACSEKDLTKRCTSHDLSLAGSALLRDTVKISETVMRSAYQDIEAEESEEDGEARAEIKEKDPTAYVLRRNFVTRMYLLDLTESEIQDILGHEIVERGIDRSYFRAENVLYRIWLKMAADPLLGSPAEERVEFPVEEGKFVRENVTDMEVVFPITRKEEKYRIMITANGANGGQMVKGSKENASVEAIILQTENLHPRFDILNMTSYLKSKYDSARKTYSLLQK